MMDQLCANRREREIANLENTVNTYMRISRKKFKRRKEVKI